MSINDLARIVTDEEQQRGVAHLKTYFSVLERFCGHVSVPFGDTELSGLKMLHAAQDFLKSIHMVNTGLFDFDLEDVPEITNSYAISLDELSFMRPDCFEIPFLTGKVLMSAAHAIEYSLRGEHFEYDDNIIPRAENALRLLDHADNYFGVAIDSLDSYMLKNRADEVFSYRSGMLYHMARSHLMVAEILNDPLYCEQVDTSIDEFACKSVAVFEELFSTTPFMNRKSAVQAVNEYGRALMMVNDDDNYTRGLTYRALAYRERKRYEQAQ